MMDTPTPERPKRGRPKKQRPRPLGPGRIAIRAFTRKANPVSPLQYSQSQLLAILLGSREAAASIMEYAQNDLRNLNGVDLEALRSMSGIGDSNAAKIVALFTLFHHLLASAQPRTDGAG